MKELNNARLNRQDGIQRLNQQITPTFAYEQNEQIINTIYMKTAFIGSRHITSDEYKMIRAIAELCPNDGGPDAVFQARGLAALFKIDFNPAECKPAAKKSDQEQDLVSQKGETYFKVSPNPASENINANYQFSDEQERYWQLFDATGRLVYTNQTRDKAGTLAIPLSKFSTGLFFLTIRENGVIIQLEKIIKQ